MSLLSFDMIGERVQYRDLSIKLCKLQRHEAHLSELKCKALDDWHPSFHKYIYHINLSLRNIEEDHNAIHAEIIKRNFKRCHATSARITRVMQSAFLETDYDYYGYCLDALFVVSESFEANNLTCPISDKSSNDVSTSDTLHLTNINQFSVMPLSLSHKLKNQYLRQKQ